MKFQLNLVIENVSIVTNIDAIPLNYIIIIIMYLFFIYLSFKKPHKEINGFF